MALRRFACAILLVPALVAAGGCDCGGLSLTGDGDGDDTDGIPPADTVGNPCTTSPECDDGEWCNGEEACDDATGLCVGGVPEPDFTQCRAPDGRYASCVDGRCDLDYEEMFVPAGPFVMGRNLETDGENCVGPGFLNWPEHVVVLSGYFIDRYEVTNMKHRRCEARGGCSNHHEGSFLRRSYYSDPAYAYYPVIGVDQVQAAAYCAYEGKLLPTEAEWEKAARGGCEIVAPETCGEEDERQRPWDSEPPYFLPGTTCEQSNHATYWGPGCPNDTDRVGIRPLGRSPYGVDDMLGNVAEWSGDCSADYEECAGGCTDPRGSCPPSPDPYDWGVALRGGSFDETCDIMWRTAAHATTSWPWLGFRCARPGAARIDGTSGGGESARGGAAEGGNHGNANGGTSVGRAAHGVDPGMFHAGGGAQGVASTASVSSALRGSRSRPASRRTRESTRARRPRRRARSCPRTPTWMPSRTSSPST